MEKHAGPSGRRAILILTDNLSTSYRLTDGQVIRELNKGGYGDERDHHRARDSAAQPVNPGKPSNPDFTPANVYELAEKTGGEWVKAENAGDSFKDMIERIRSRYMLAYHAPDAQPGTVPPHHGDAGRRGAEAVSGRGVAFARAGITRSKAPVTKSVTPIVRSHPAEMSLLKYSFASIFRLSSDGSRIVLSGDRV